jgi:hypothetical protein
VTEEAKIARIARAAHNTLVVYCRMAGDYSIREWEDAEEWQRDDTVKMVRSTLKGGHSAEQEHGRWFKGKVDRGYVYGREKNDDENKGPLTNPNMLPYRDLPLYNRMKDNLLTVVVIGIAAHYGMLPEKVPEMVFA